jgi:hypothetical protein
MQITTDLRGMQVAVLHDNPYVHVLVNDFLSGTSFDVLVTAGALVRAGAVRAIELDINPYAVAGYLYVHHATGPVPAPVVPGQQGIPGQLLLPYSRDFLAVVAN